MFNFFEKASKAVSEIVSADEQQRAQTGTADPSQPGSSITHPKQAPQADQTSGGGVDLLTGIVGAAKCVSESLGAGTQKTVGGFTQQHDVEEPMQMLDSKGGKIQVPSAGGEGIRDQKASAESSTGGDFLTGVLGVVTDAAGKLQEGAAHGGQTIKDGAGTAAQTTKDTAKDASIATQEQIDNVTKSLGGLVAGFLGGKSTDDHATAQVSGHDDIEEPMQVLDSQGGKIRVPTAGGEGLKDQKAETSKGGDFFTGVLGVVTDMAGKLQEGAAHGGQTVKEGAGAAAQTTKDKAEGAAIVTQEQLDHITKGLGGLVGGFLGGKSTDEKAKAESGDASFSNQKPVIDDLEGEIVVVKTKGFTKMDEPQEGGDVGGSVSQTVVGKDKTVFTEYAWTTDLATNPSTSNAPTTFGKDQNSEKNENQ